MPLNTIPYFIDIISEVDETGDTTIVGNEEAVREFIRNVLNTVKGHKKYDPLFGTNLHRYLFEGVDLPTSHQIASEVHNSIKVNDETNRVQELNVRVIPKPDDNAYEVNISYFTDISPRQQSLQVVLERIR